MIPETVTISLEEYEDLCEAKVYLSALVEAGLDGVDWLVDDANHIMEQWSTEEEEYLQ